MVLISRCFRPPRGTPPTKSSLCSLSDRGRCKRVAICWFPPWRRVGESGSFMSDQLGQTWLFRQGMRALSIWIPCRRRNSRGSMLRPTHLYWPRGRTALGSCWLRRLPADFRSSARIVPAERTSHTRRLWQSELQLYPTTICRPLLLPWQGYETVTRPASAFRYLQIRIARRSHGRPTDVVTRNKSRLILVNAVALS